MANAAARTQPRAEEAPLKSPDQLPSPGGGDPRRVERYLPELMSLERLIHALLKRSFERPEIPIDVRVESTIVYDRMRLPIYSIVIGSRDPRVPTLGVFGGVHGLERVGSEVVLAWLQTVLETLSWDASFRERLRRSRLVFMPLVNPVGVFSVKRANGNGVDLMRNSPTRAEDKPALLVGGHSISHWLPWYSPEVRSFAEMEPESRALCGVVQREMYSSVRSVSVDVHSGFGSIDRLWFPWAKTRRPPPDLEEIMSLKRLFDRSYPNHVYQIEPQSLQYTTHGDLWDWLYDEHRNRDDGDRSFLPFTLELGSWMWLKKNPRQLFSSLGPFNPVLPHRLKRILRRHITLFDFLHRALLNSESWMELDEEMRAQLRRRAMDLWYTPEVASPNE